MVHRFTSEPIARRLSADNSDHDQTEENTETENKDNTDNKGIHSKDHIKSHNNNFFILALLTIAWYSCAIVTITTSKELLLQIPVPLTLCSCQFLMASILSNVVLSFTRSHRVGSSNGESLVQLISVSYTFGFVLTNYAFSLASAGFAETIKSAEPLSTVLLGYLLFQERASNKTYLTLLMICFGVAISCYQNEAFNLYGMILAAGSNFCFSGRAVLAKKLNSKFPGDFNDLNLFSYISRFGLLFLIPIAFVGEGKIILDIIYNKISADSFTYSFKTIVFLLVVNGIMFASYNLLSYIVLNRTDLVTHSILNVFRRVFIIVITTLYFGKYLNFLNIFGVLIAITGVLLYGLVKSEKKSRLLEYKAQINMTNKKMEEV